MKITACFLILMFTASVWAENIYVKSKYADLQRHPQKKSGLKRVKHGEALQKVRKVRNWFSVKYQGKTWWVYQGKVSPRKPRQSLVTANYADNVATGSAVRGLSPMALKFAKDQNVKEKHQQFMDYHQSFITTDKEDFTPQLTSRGIELMKITTEMLEKFQEEGKIGVYANSGDQSEFEEQ